MLVKDVMTTEPVTVTTRTPVKTALTLLARHRVTSLPVLDRDQRICGVVSEADLIRDLVARDPRAHELVLGDDRADLPQTVGDVMTPHAITVQAETDLALAVELVTSTSVKSLPVIDHHDRVVGMLSRSDVVRVLARADDAIAGEVDALLTSVGLDGWFAEVTNGRAVLTGPDDTSDAATAYVVAGTVPGVLSVEVG
jgi:CBS-domain-containing membrane protein